ncbi:MAG: HupE/UreJ family protein [Gammaproteobacteria bacterium]
MPATLYLFLTVFVMSMACPTGSAIAHTRSESHSTWNFHNGNIDVNYLIKTRDIIPIASLLSSDHTPFITGVVRQVTDKLVLKADNEPCIRTHGPEVNTAVQFAYIRIAWRLRCPDAMQYTIDNNALFSLLPGLIHFAKIKFDNQLTVERIFTGTDRVWIFNHRNVPDTRSQAGNSQTSGSTLFDYFKLGTTHILSGYDHIAFLLAVILLIGWQRQQIGTLLITITGFTLGHSLTLVVTALKLVQVKANLVEALIGYSIALVAIEVTAKYTSLHHYLGSIATIVTGLLVLIAFVAVANPLYISLFGLAIFCFCHFNLIERIGDKATFPYPMLTLLFGTIHGFGFARSLLDVGFPSRQIIPALFGFNIGVEAGQLTIVLIMLAVIRLAGKLASPSTKPYLPVISSSALCGLGMYWFVLRAFA